LQLRTQLDEQLDKLGRLSWLSEELSALDDLRSFTTEPEQAWLRVKGLRALDPARTRLARELGAWRERRAVERNRPRGWILDDVALREIVLQVPRSVEALSSVAELPPGVIKNCGEELLACVRSAEVPDPPPPIQGRSRPDPVKLALVKKLSGVNQAVAADLGLSPEVLATRRDLEQLAEGRRDVAVLRGWRRTIIGDRMLAAIV
jgi:ribonuclease D